MCDTCGCGHDGFSMHKVSEDLSHSHDHHHDHDHEHGEAKVLSVETDILAKNNLLAERNRGYFEAKNIKSFNLVSSPGSGKTTLLEKLIAQLKDTYKVYVIEGDQQTTNDAKRIEEAGAEALQINTGNGCHLDAHMINHAVKSLDPDSNSILFIENVGNLVCPALFDLGEQRRIVIASTTEGEDKPLKYPNMFQTASLCILNKTDLLPYLDFNKNDFLNNLKKVHPNIDLLEASAKKSEGIAEIVQFILNN
jgi:hydrogenase nickel incorporation protein HypB